MGNFFPLDILLHFLRAFCCRDSYCCIWPHSYRWVARNTDPICLSFSGYFRNTSGVLRQSGFLSGRRWDAICVTRSNWSDVGRSWFLLQHRIPQFSDEMHTACVPTAHRAVAFLEISQTLQIGGRKTNQQPGNHKRFTRRTRMPVASQAACVCLPVLRINTEIPPLWTLLPWPISNVYIKSLCMGIN